MGLRKPDVIKTGWKYQIMGADLKRIYEAREISKDQIIMKITNYYYVVHWTLSFQQHCNFETTFLNNQLLFIYSY